LFTTVGYTDEFFFNARFQRELDRAPSFTRWDARASWTSFTETWEVSAFVNNITNELGVLAVETEGVLVSLQARGSPRAFLFPGRDSYNEDIESTLRINGSTT